MIRVGFIIYGLDRPLSGISRYRYELAQVYEKIAGDVEIILLAAGGLGPLSKTQLRTVPLPGCKRLPGMLTLGHILLPTLARQLKLDIIHDPGAISAFFFGGGGAKLVSTVHDVIPVSYPGNSSTLDNLIYRRWLPYQLPRLEMVLTDSEYSRQDILRYMKLPPERVRAILLGVRKLFMPIPLEEAQAHIRERFKIDYPFILFVGNLTKRKNIHLVLQGFAAISSEFPDLRFVLVGPNLIVQTPVGKMAEELGIADRVVLTGSVADEDLPYLFNAAEVFTFPSFYEGFGLPILEAMACGTPVITSTATSLPEVAGNAALLVSPDSVDEMATALRRVLTDTRLRKNLREAGLAWSAQFTWEKTARETLEVFRSLYQ